jgi:hypothetical protein
MHVYGARKLIAVQLFESPKIEASKVMAYDQLCIIQLLFPPHITLKRKVIL